MVEYATILLFPVAAGIEKPNRRGKSYFDYSRLSRIE